MTQSKKKAKYWFQKSYDNGNQEAQENLVALLKTGIKIEDI